MSSTANAAAPRRTIRTIPGGAGVALLAVLIAGCESSGGTSQAEVNAWLADKPASLHGVLTPVAAGPKEDQALNRMRAGLAAMEDGHDELAARLLDDALLTVETIYGGDESAQAARSMFGAEDSKVFRGEPYERAMAYYYRGVLYLKAGDYENARASFRSGALQDGLAANEEYAQDFALLDFLDGWASHCAGDRDLAREAWALARKGGGKVAPGTGDNLLVLADLGRGPVKYAAGEHNELLKVRRDEGAPGIASVRLGAASRSLPNDEDIAWQAMTRGGREFDAVLANKAVFKEDAAEVADAAADVAAGGAAVASVGAAIGDHDLAGAGAAVGLVGALFSIGAQAASDATETAADTRQWDNLPGKVSYGAFRVDAAAPAPSISLSGGGAAVTRHGGDETCRVAWLRSPQTPRGS